MLLNIKNDCLWAAGRRTALAFACVAIGAPSFASETGFSGAVTLTSEYIYRGQALSDGNPALQFGLDYQHGSGWFAGAWATTVDIVSRFGRRDVEVDYYVGYSHAFESPLALSATFIRYTYPGQTGFFDYDHDQWLASATLLESYVLEVGYSDDIYGFDRVGRHVELRAEQPVASAWVVSAGLGRNDLESLRGNKYLYWDIGVSARFARLNADLRWYDNETIDGFVGYLSAGSQLVVSLTASF
jgi:uncharacterized protein (TIGR02001 family)